VVCGDKGSLGSLGTLRACNFEGNQNSISKRNALVVSQREVEGLPDTRLGTTFVQMLDELKKYGAAH
jgi:hypothetical protein